MNKVFTRFAKKAAIKDTALRKAIRDAGVGLIDADLGGGVIKQRIARSGEGKSGGFRTIILFKATAFAFFVYGFEKKERDNISARELAEFKNLAREMLAYRDDELTHAVKNGALIEVKGDGKKTVS